ncbi:MAG: LPS export ABC transporter periplasmic protein LptC [Bacteroidales bacterium 45-6]|nr:MAG: LPS export ABC transporter periplasmic protein LptC [Bacteroidales bacterium 45-6]
MNYPTPNSIFKHPAVLLTLAFCCILASCKKEKQEYVHKKYNPEFVPTIDTDSVTMKISDSGRVKYKVVTKTMQIFDKAKDPHWLFPHALYLEQYDSAFHVNATIQADTAWNYTQRGLWRLKGHVVIKNVKGSIFKTEELFWDQNQRKVYTDKFIKITTPDRNLKGYGMDASQDLSTYQIRKPSGTMDMKEEAL